MHIITVPILLIKIIKIGIFLFNFQLTLYRQACLIASITFNVTNCLGQENIVTYMYFGWHIILYSGSRHPLLPPQKLISSLWQLFLSAQSHLCVTLFFPLHMHTSIKNMTIERAMPTRKSNIVIPNWTIVIGILFFSIGTGTISRLGTMSYISLFKTPVSLSHIIEF